MSTTELNINYPLKISKPSFELAKNISNIIYRNDAAGYKLLYGKWFFKLYLGQTGVFFE